MYFVRILLMLVILKKSKYDEFDNVGKFDMIYLTKILNLL